MRGGHCYFPNIHKKTMKNTDLNIQISYQIEYNNKTHTVRFVYIYVRSLQTYNDKLKCIHM